MKIFRQLLFPFTLLIIAFTEARNFFFSIGILKQKQFKIPIIVVGNISTGGTGKSPLIDYLLKLLINVNPASLSRGYGRKSRGFYNGTNSSSSQMIGDEPLMLKKLNPQANICVHENRVNGIQKILETNSATKVIFTYLMGR